jgi:hypothetical protein
LGLRYTDYPPVCLADNASQFLASKDANAGIFRQIVSEQHRRFTNSQARHRRESLTEVPFLKTSECSITLLENSNCDCDSASEQRSGWGRFRSKLGASRSGPGSWNGIPRWCMGSLRMLWMLPGGPYRHDKEIGGRLSGLPFELETRRLT